MSLRVFRARLLKLVELASFHIYTQRNDADWDPPSGNSINGHRNQPVILKFDHSFDVLSVIY